MKDTNGEPYIVSYANFNTTRLVDANENYHASVQIGTAKQMTQDAGLDLVCFNKPEKTALAFCKIINYGKWKYNNGKKKKKQSKEKQKNHQGSSPFPRYR